jgi:nitrite reductase/ring-hydroxylating ferredoxin subunit
MTRYEFLKSMGFKGAALMALMTSCIREEDTYINALTEKAIASTPVTPTPPVATTPGNGTSTSTTPGNGTNLSTIKNRLLTLDLTTAANAALLSAGGYVAVSGIVVAQVSAGVHVAATQTCSHKPRNRIIFNRTEFYCTDHGARFDLSGNGLNSLGSRGIAVYKVATDGKTLVVYS